MHCPYCISDISDVALVCPQCRRDLYLFRPLLEKIASLEAQIARFPAAHDALHDRINELDARVSTATQNPISSQPPVALADVAGVADVPNVSAASAPSVVVEVVAPTSWLRPLLASAISVLLTVVCLMLAHLLITVVYDFNTLVLRLTSLIIPLPFGAALASFFLARNSNPFPVGIFLGLVSGLTAVFGMSVTIHLVDHIPVLPETVRDWREFLEYSASICFSFVVGLIFGAILFRLVNSERRRSADELAMRLAKMLSGGQTAVESLQGIANKITVLSGSIAATGTSMAAAYTGLKAAVGG